MLTPLRDAARDRCGGKAATLSTLLRHGLPVPDGFVVPFEHDPRDPGTRPVRADALADAVTHELARMADPVVAVRSSAASEDTQGASAAGQYESVLGVRGAADVCRAVTACRASARSVRVSAYWHRIAGGSADPAAGIAVLVQRLVAADVSGVMFTPGHDGGETRIEASWGLGTSVVGGTVVPDRYEVAPDGSLRCTIGRKDTRLDPAVDGTGLVERPVSDPGRVARALEDDDVAALTALGSRVATLLGGPQDIEWAIADGETWVLQARPVTAPLPPSSATAPTAASVLTGSPGSRGVVTAPARVVRGPADFGRVRPGEIVVCPVTDPAWTPLFTIAGGVVTETGGTLSHAAIVAREYGIPAVLGVTGATRLIDDGDRLTLDGAAGTVTPG